MGLYSRGPALTSTTLLKLISVVCAKTQSLTIISIAHIETDASSPRVPPDRQDEKILNYNKIP